MRNDPLDDPLDENYFTEIAEEGEALEEEAPSPKPVSEAGGHHRLFFIGVCLLLLGFAAPLLSIYLIKSPQPDQHIFIFGLSYYQLVFIFFLSSALMVHASLFFLRASPTTILLIFIFLLFCCFPFIAGLKNNLTLQQAILDIPFFSDWPFFFKPGYLMIEFLIPVGIIIYLFLQIKSLFSKKPHGYAFLGAAIYISVAAFLGFSTLIQAQQPNIVTSLTRQIGKRIVLKADVVGTAYSQPAQEAIFPAPDIPNNTDMAKMAPETRPPAAVKGPPADHKNAMGIETKIHVLSNKVDRIMVQLDQMRIFFTANQENQGKKGAVVQENEVEEPTGDKTTIADLQQEMQLLSEKVDHISTALGQMANLFPERSESLQKKETNQLEKESNGEKKIKEKEGDF